MKLGFTGTQHGMTGAQCNALRRLLFSAQGFIRSEFHHGDCIGADAEAHDVAELLGWKTIIHPPANNKKRAYKRAEVTLLPAPYLVRNRAIVNATEVLIAAPQQFTEQLRSGTWFTVRYAQKKKRKIYIVLPDGSVELS